MTAPSLLGSAIADAENARKKSAANAVPVSRLNINLHPLEDEG
jgi:hypothetical protein